MLESSEDETSKLSTSQLTRKRKRHGRITDASRQLRAQSHITGEDCKCKLFKCFDSINEKERSTLIQQFNSLGNWNEQSSYLTSLISICLVAKRRPRKDDSDTRDCSFRYIVRVKRNESIIEIPVCAKAFVALHGITRRRLATIQASLKLTGKSPKDKRGHHNNRPWKHSDEKKEAVHLHINSLKGRSSHYSKEKSDKIYLSEDLNVTKLHEMYLEKYPHLPVSRESYREIFNQYYNISFGYPRTDTCSACDKFKAELSILKKKLETMPVDKKAAIENTIKRITTENEVHKLRAVTFYTRKREARKHSKKSEISESICMDFQKNLPLPNISTNDVYYKRQLFFYTFNIHQLSNSHSLFYAYTEVDAKKGANEVISFLNHYFTNEMNKNVKEVDVFCDSCSGQNKNYAVMLYLHYVVHVLKRLDNIHQITFPMRGQSYLECDKNMGLIKSKSVVEVPNEWITVFENARKTPSPFKVVPVDQEIVRDWSDFLLKDCGLYVKKAPFKTRPLKVLKVSKTDKNILHRSTYNGAWTSSKVLNRDEITLPDHIRTGEIIYPPRAYEGKNIKVSFI